MNKKQVVAAKESDVPVVLDFIRRLAKFENLAHEVTATEELLRANLFGPKRQAEVVFVEEVQSPGSAQIKVGFALFFESFSTFLGRPGLYLEDLFVLPDYRSQGYGKMMLKHLAQLSVERNYGRMEWSVLDWNSEAIRFYRGLGAQPQSDWTTFRLQGQSLVNLARS